MPRARTFILIVATLYLQGCVSTTRILSNPPGAKVYVNGEYVGVTPYNYKDSKLVLSETSIKLQKLGYKPLNIVLKRNEEIKALPLVFGIIGPFPLLLWSMGYKPKRTYELERSSSTEE